MSGSKAMGCIRGLLFELFSCSSDRSCRKQGTTAAGGDLATLIVVLALGALKEGLTGAVAFFSEVTDFFKDLSPGKEEVSAKIYVDQHT